MNDELVLATLRTDEEKLEWVNAWKERALRELELSVHVRCPDCAAKLKIVSRQRLPEDTHIEFVEHVT